MNDAAKISASHLRRAAYVYLRQSTPAQLEHHKESTQRQYALVSKATTLGWPAEQIVIVDEDLGVSGSGIAERNGFARLTAEVALGHVGIVLGLEVSRVARNNADWYRLLDLCGITDTLIGDADGIYHPAMFNDRLVLGLKGTMSEAELHVMRARLLGGIRNKAARGELHQALPIGFIWGEADGEVRFHPDESIRAAIRTVFAKFKELGSVRRVWLWFRSEGLSFPTQGHGKPIRWAEPKYIGIHQVLTNPVYAGAYVYGKTRHEVTLDASGVRRKRVRKLPQSQWPVSILNHHEGYIDWTTYEANRARISANTHPLLHQAGGGAVREGAALLQGIAVCGQCGRKLRTHYTGRRSSAHYHCAGGNLAGGRRVYCLRIGARQVDEAVARAVLASLESLGMQAALDAAERLEADYNGSLQQWRLAVERASYEAQRAERRYRAVDPENRLVARGLEAEWEGSLRELDKAKAELKRREVLRPRKLNNDERAHLQALGSDLHEVWRSPTTLLRDKKELLRTVLEEVVITIDKNQDRASVMLRWRGGVLTEIDLDLAQSRRQATARTDEDTVALVRRLAAHYPDAMIASILNRQERATAQGHRFTANLVGSLRRSWNIPVYESPATPPDGELLTIGQAASVLEISPSTIHRWLNEGVIPGEQLTPGAPWRIRVTDELRAKVFEEAPEGYLTMYQTMRLLGVSRQTVLQRVKRGQIEAIHVKHGRKKGLRLKVIYHQSDLFKQAS